MRVALLLAVVAGVAYSPSGIAETVAITLTGDFTLGNLDRLASGKTTDRQFVLTKHGEFDAIEMATTLSEKGLEIPASGVTADITLAFPAADLLRLRWSKGSHSETSDFRPMAEELVSGQPVTLESFGGRSSDGVMPYFNVAGAGGGVILAIGWTGDWRAVFDQLEPGKLLISAGLKSGSIRAPAGESLRLPSILLMAYRGDWIDGQNKFRRLMLKHFTPSNAAPMKLMPVAASVHGMIGFNDTTEDNLTKLAADIAATRLPLDTYWLDAGWNTGGFAAGQGNPDADAARFPNGLTTVGEAVHRAGFRFLAWFEPERAMRGTWLAKERPHWLLSPSGSPAELRYQENDGFHLLDLGNADARAWAVESVAKYIESAKLEFYRQDFNLYPSYFWHTNEVAGEKGLREVRYINGMYAYLDTLRARFPKLILDNCASGGRRLDFEMMKRTVPLWRSDSCWDSKDFPRNVQAMAYGLSLWFPLHGLGAASTDIVALRSGMGACASFAINFRDPAQVEALRAHLLRFLPVRELFTKDFYPLTPWSVDGKAWLGFQYHDPASGRGLVQAFCADTTGNADLVVQLRGVDSALRYRLSNWDGLDTTRLSGAEMKSGVPLHATRPNDAIVLEYAPE